MLRVLPAQLTTTSVAGFGATSNTRYTSSPPGTSIAVGMLITLYSSMGRLSRTTRSSLRNSRSFSSSARISGGLRFSRRYSPNVLLGTFSPENNSNPHSFQPSKPPVSTLTFVYPKLSSRFFADCANTSLPVGPLS